jgi:hypothetical protein
MDTPRSGFLKRLAAGSLLVAAAAAAQAQASDWTALDYSLGGGAATMMLIDWAQTRYAARHPDQYSSVTPPSASSRRPQKSTSISRSPLSSW